MSYRNQPIAARDAGAERNADLAEQLLLLGSDSEDPATDVSDVIANLLHFCDRAGIDHDYVINRAEAAYFEETVDDACAKRDERRFPNEEVPA